MISITYQRKESNHSRAVFRLVFWQFTLVSIRPELMWYVVGLGLEKMKEQGQICSINML